jgi:hypothetical protein
MFYLPGFMALLLLKTGEPTSFGITVELLMLSSASAIVGGLFIGAESEGGGADTSSKVGVWSGCLVLELLSVVPFLDAIPALFHELANSRLLHDSAVDKIDVNLGASEMLPMVAILPFLLYELSGFGTLPFVLSKTMNWIVNAVILCLIIASYIANREQEFGWERRFSSTLVILMLILVFYGILKLRKMQRDFDLRAPKKEPK